MYQNFTGTAVLPPQLQVANFQGNHITKWELANSSLPSQLVAINFAGNRLTQNLSQILPRLPNLLALNVNSNGMTALPTGFASSRLHSLDLDENNITVRFSLLVPCTVEHRSQRID
jgi:Leucine-rich repeat (LRR) protein